MKFETTRASYWLASKAIAAPIAILGYATAVAHVGIAAPCGR
jgi:hypothetical protein